MKQFFVLVASSLLVFGCAPQDPAATPPIEPSEETAAEVIGTCEGAGPQTPRDISSTAGTNPTTFDFAPDVGDMNLCNIHFHKNAEHKGPGYSVFAGPGEFGGYQCNGTADLTEAEKAPFDGNQCAGAVPGDTVEVHWVFTSCDVAPGPGLGSCVSSTCLNPQLRVEAQTFLLVNDETAQSFQAFGYEGPAESGRHQPLAVPSGTGDPVRFLGSTTGPSYSEEVCSGYQVSWSVRPECAKLSIQSLSEWCGGNVFDENKAHGVRELVTDPALLSEIGAE